MTGDPLVDATLVVLAVIAAAAVAVLGYVVPLLLLDEWHNLTEWWNAGKVAPRRSDDDTGQDDTGGGWARLVPRYDAGVPEPGAPPPPPVVEAPTAPHPRVDVWEAVAAFQGVVIRPIRDRARLALAERAPAA